MSPDGPRTPGWVLRAAAVCGLVAVVGALALPFAPVVVSSPTVTWPREPGRLESTLLALTAQRPLGLDVRVGCDAVRAAAAGGQAVVLATAVPGSGQAGAAALVVSAAGDRVQVRARGEVLVDEPVPAGACAYRITGEGDGRPVDVRGPPTPVSGIGPAVPVERVPPAPSAVAGPTSAVVAVTRDGAEVGSWRGERLPDVDVLVSDLTTGAVGVTLRVDDEGTSAPAPLKVALAVVVGLALLLTAALLALADRAQRRIDQARRGLPWPRRPGWAALVDVGVVAVLVTWTFVAPATDDDGYFATQARNAALSGAVGDYFSFWNRSFTPFTWFPTALAHWQELAGTAPVPQRMPAAVCGLLTWLCVRRLVRPAGVAPALARGAAAVAFLAWWVPYDMGVRPEAVVAVCAAAAAVALLDAARTRRPALAWLALALAGAGAFAHPEGVVVGGVVLAGLPLLGRLVRGATPAVTALRAVAVGSGAAVGLLLGFADGALRDVLRGTDAVGAVLDPDGWADEITRYAFLLDPIPMGGFAKRAAVLAALGALAWFALLAVAARARRVPLPAPLALTGTATGLGLALLALTPSKWTHHFGALAGVGSAFLGLLLVTAVPLTRAVLAGGRLPRAVPAALVVSVVAACALSWHGPNSWAYAWLDGVAAPYRRPLPVLDHPLVWAALVGAVAVVLLRRRRDPLAAAPVVVAASLALTVGVTVGLFGVAGARGVPSGSLWADAVADPAGTRCGAAAAVRVLDAAGAVPLAAISPPGPSAGFVTGSGWFPGAAPPPGPAWGSLAGDVQGASTTSWYGLAPGEPAVVLAAGSFGDATGLTAEYAQLAGPAVLPLASAPLGDGATSPHWRTFLLDPPAGADAVRLTAVDRTGAPDGWLAFTAPAAARVVPLADLIPRDAPVAVGWQVAFAHPCQRPPALRDGVTEPPVYAVLRAGGPDADPLAGLGDIAWQPDRGGVYAAAPRSQSVLTLPTVGPVDPYVQVVAFRTPLARAAYTLVPGGRTVAGADTAVAPPRPEVDAGPR